MPIWNQVVLEGEKAEAYGNWVAHNGVRTTGLIIVTHNRVALVGRDQLHPNAVDNEILASAGFFDERVNKAEEIRDRISGIIAESRAHHLSLIARDANSPRSFTAKSPRDFAARHRARSFTGFRGAAKFR